MNEIISGQSAIEYLMTYGWMLLVVAITGSTIFAVASDQSVESISGFTGSDVQINDFGVTVMILVLQMILIFNWI